MGKILVLVISCFILIDTTVLAQRYQFLSDSERVAMLEPPKGKIDVIIDSDAYNEIDDQYAIVYSLRSNNRLNIKAIYAAPFLNSRSTSAGDGMQKSYEEILRVLDFMDIKNEPITFKGSNQFMEKANNPVQSDAALHLVNAAKSYSKESPLYILALGAITNISSAILIDPAITSKIVVVWLGGNAFNWPGAKEFNCEQDIHATRVIFDSGVPFVQITVMPVVSHLTTTIPEMEYYLNGNGKVADYLLEILKQYYPENQDPGYSKIIWDIAGVAWLINPDWVPTEIRTSPIITDNWTYSFNPDRHLIRSAYFVKRNEIYNDFLKKVVE